MIFYENVIWKWETKFFRTRFHYWKKSVSLLFFHVNTVGKTVNIITFHQIQMNILEDYFSVIALQTDEWRELSIKDNRNRNLSIPTVERFLLRNCNIKILLSPIMFVIFNRKFYPAERSKFLKTSKIYKLACNSRKRSKITTRLLLREKLRLLRRIYCIVGKTGLGVLCSLF